MRPRSMQTGGCHRQGWAGWQLCGLAAMPLLVIASALLKGRSIELPASSRDSFWAQPALRLETGFLRSAISSKILHYSISDDEIDALAVIYHYWKLCGPAAETVARTRSTATTIHKH